MSQRTHHLPLAVTLLVLLLPSSWSLTRADEGPVQSGTQRSSPCAGAQQAGEQTSTTASPAKSPCPCSQAHPPGEDAERRGESPCQKPCGKKTAGKAAAKP